MTEKLFAITFGTNYHGTLVDEHDDGTMSVFYFTKEVAEKVIADFQSINLLKQCDLEPKDFYKFCLTQEKKNPKDCDITTTEEWEKIKKTLDEFK